MTDVLPRIFCFSFFALALLAQQGSAPHNAMPETFQVSGKVVDAVSSVPLVHAVVTIAPTAQRDALRTEVTGGDGRFHFENVVPGKYVLAARRKGHIAQSFNAHGRYSSAIAVGPNLVSDGLVFRMWPEASLSGKITDEYDEPVRDARVTLFQSGIVNGKRRIIRRGEKTADDEGRYYFDQLSAGRYFLAVSANPWYVEALKLYRGPAKRSPLDVAYPVTFYADATGPAGALPILLAAGGNSVADMTLHTVPAVHVRFRAGSLRGATANLGPYFDDFQFAENSRPAPVEWEWDPDTTVSPGRYVVNVNSWMDGGIWTGLSRTFDLTGDTEIDVSEAPSATVSVAGLVRFETARPVPANGVVELRDRKSHRVFSQEIPSGGKFEFKQGVPAGSYDVGLNVPASFMKSITVTGAKIAGHILEIGNSGAKLIIVLSQEVGRVDGVAVKNGKPFAGAMIVLVPAGLADNADLFRRDQSDTDGTFTLSSVVPGKYTVLAIEDGWDQEWETPEVLKRYLPEGEAVQIESTEQRHVRIKVQ